MAGTKIGFIITHSSDDPERATLPFMIAAVSPAMDVEPMFVLQAEGVRLAVKGFAETVQAEGLTPLETLLAAQIEAGAPFMVCSPCLATRGIGEDDLREGTFIGGGAKVLEMLKECQNVVVY